MSYALVTGASKGIGKAIAEELAARGYHLLLVARSGEVLKAEAERLAKTYGIQADYLGLDLTAEDSPRRILDYVEEKSYPVQILVNNAGYGLSGAFEKFSIPEQSDMMRLNMMVPVELCHLFLPTLKKHSRAYILNIASTAAYQAVPNMSVYAATKAFILYFSRGLRQELRKTPVSVTCISPGSTDTEFVLRAQIGEKGLKTAKKVNMSAEAVAKLAIDALFAGKAELITGALNKLGAFLVWLLPKGLVEKTAMKIYE